MRRQLAILLVCCWASPVSAALLFYDGFNPREPDSGTYNYRPGELLAYFPDNDDDNPNGQYNDGYDKYWRRVGAQARGDVVGITGGSLSYPGFKPSKGNSALFDFTVDTGVRLTRVEVPGGPLAEGDTWYWSALMKVTDVARMTSTATGLQGGNMLGGFHPGIGGLNTNTDLNLLAGQLIATRSTANVNQYFIGTAVRSNERQFALTLPQNDGDTVLVVVGYTRNPGTDDTARLWLNPDPSTFAAAVAPPSDLTVTSARTVIPRSFALRSSDEGTGENRPFIQFDELRVGTTWAAVTPPIPEPATAVLFLIGCTLIACNRFARHRRTPP